MRVRLRGIHRVRAKLASGEVREYYYAWRGGPKLDGAPGSEAFLRSYNAAIEARKETDTGTISALVRMYRSSPEFTGLAEITKRDYRAVFDKIRQEFGTMPIKAATDPRARRLFKAWRNRYSATPRKADRYWSVLKRVFSYAVDNGEIPLNPCAGGGRLWSGSRKESIWTPQSLLAFRSVAARPLVDAMELAIATGQRQGDLLRLTWSAYDGERLNLRQSKTKRRVSILLDDATRRLLDERKAANDEREQPSVTVLTNSRGKAWTSDGFKTSWGRATARAGVKGLTFHDLRGTAITQAAVAGASVLQIASRFGYSPQDVEAMLDRHYLANSQSLGDAVVGLNEHNKRTKV
ncbi:MULTISPECIES: site-specific integrase [Alphaproteobacteria]|uniref:site-specific integrase n=1 Tax=Alphaproteobacteria TaxID=28211 RepID=UPI003A94F385